MKQTFIFAFVCFVNLLYSQEIETYSIDSIGRRNWQLTTTVTITNNDSTTVVRGFSVKFDNRKAARQYINTVFAAKIKADSALVENAKRRIALAKASRAALLADLSRPPAGKQVEKPPDVTAPATTTPAKATKKKKGK